MNVAVAGRCAGIALVLGGCASGAWRFAGSDTTLNRGDLPGVPPSHRSIERVTLRVHGREFEFVGYRTCDPATGDVRSQLLLDSGISVLDVEVRGAQDRRISGSVFEAIPHFADMAIADLRRTWGSRSVFGARIEPPELGDWPTIGGNIVRGRRLVSDGVRTLPAESLGDGSWLAIVPRDTLAFGHDPVRVTLLGADLVPEATIDYSDFDEDGVPREIRLVDLRDGHALDVEVEEVRLAGAKE